MDILAVICALAGSYFTAMKTNRKRLIGFTLYLFANVFWVVWCFMQPTIPIPLVIQSVVFCVPSTIGLINNRKD